MRPPSQARSRSIIAQRQTVAEHAGRNCGGAENCRSEIYNLVRLLLPRLSRERYESTASAADALYSKELT